MTDHNLYLYLVCQLRSHFFRMWVPPARTALSTTRCANDPLSPEWYLTLDSTRAFYDFL